MYFLLVSVIPDDQRDTFFVTPFIGAGHKETADTIIITFFPPSGSGRHNYIIYQGPKRASHANAVTMLFTIKFGFV